MDLKEIEEGYWNYRIIRFDDTIITRDNRILNKTRYKIHEVFYRKDNTAWSISKTPLALCFEDFDDFLYLKKEIKRALNRTVLLFEGNENEPLLIDTGEYFKSKR